MKVQELYCQDYLVIENLVQIQEFLAEIPVLCQFLVLLWALSGIVGKCGKWVFDLVWGCFGNGLTMALPISFSCCSRLSLLSNRLYGWCSSFEFILI